MRWALLILALTRHASLPAQAPVRSLKQLKAFFVTQCARCHGPDGSGHSPEGKKLVGIDFTDAAWQARESDAEMVKTIRKGIFFGLVMRPYGKRISEAEALILARDILRQSEKGKVIAP
jgi:mono/diheme cytochrome c family protein